jgi:hypothetical protein
MKYGLDSLLGPHTHRDKPLSWIMCVHMPPPSRCVTHENLTSFCFSFLEIVLQPPRNLGAVRAMGKRGGHTNTGEGVKGKKVRTTSDDVGGKSVSEKWEPFGHHHD